MARRFNVTGLCVPEKHYMVDLSDRISKIRAMVDDGSYFMINCARQYGKTTTLTALAKNLQQDHLVISLDFQMLGSASFQNENVFSLSFLRILLRELKRHRAAQMPGMAGIIGEMQESVDADEEKLNLLELFEYLIKLCEYSEKAVVLIIDEVDSASNDQVFLDFLAQLRNYYLEREAKGTTTFQSVILAGVYDIKNLKRKIRSAEEHKTNSPWNIAADFDINMSLSRQGIAGMLREYEADHDTGMNPEEMAGLLYDYTSGYPFLVSRLCKLMDEKMPPEIAWTKEGFLETVRRLLLEKNTLFESLIGKLTDYPELEQMLGELLFSGKAITYNPMSPAINLALMFGFVKNANGKVIPANRIFDTLLYNHFLSLDELHSSDMYKASLQDKDTFIQSGQNLRKERAIMKIYLASASPRRKELLRQVGISFKTMPSTVEEKSTKTKPHEVVEELSYQKAVDVCGKLSAEGKEDFVVIGADTVVSCWGEILGKPADKTDAVKMLEKLQGGCHQVYTGVTLAWKYKDTPAMYDTFSECTDVTMYSMSAEEIRKYVDSGEPMDKAGAYAIQGLCAAYVQGICGDYNNVVGLPVGRVCQELRRRGLWQ